MGDSLCDMFLKEHEKYLPVHGMIQSSAAKPKTPYQLDLEVKDRKPSIIPKVGDRVKIKSREWYEKWRIFIPVEHVNVMCLFSSEMAPFCGKVLTVRRINGDSFFLGDEKGEVVWTFSLEMFEEVYPVQEQLSSKFPRIDLSSPLTLQSPFQVQGSELVLSKEELNRMFQQFAANRVVKPKPKPKLKQIKTTHLIKLKKL